MGIFTKPKPPAAAQMQPTTVPVKSPLAQQWLPPQKGVAPLPVNYAPPARQAFPPPVNYAPPAAPPRPVPAPAAQQPPQPWAIPSPMMAPAPPQQPPLPAGNEMQPTIVATNPEAPVFVKIDRYEDILTELSDMKATIQNIKNLAEVFNLVREVQLDSISILDGLMKELERSQIKLDKILGRLEDVEDRVKGSRYDMVRKGAPEELGDIEDRIKKIREEIQKLSK